MRIASTLMLVFCSGVVYVGCGDDDGGNPGQDAAWQPDSAMPDSATSDSAAPDSAPPDSAAPDASPSDAGSTDWPPNGPFHSGMSCTLPACDTGATETVDLSGTWTQTLVTQSHTCNSMVETFNPSMVPGAEQVSDLSYPRQGECVYADTIGGTVVGVIKGNILVICQVMPPQSGVTAVIEGVITFSGTTGSGPVTSYLFGVPIAPSECEAHFQSTLVKQ